MAMPPDDANNIDDAAAPASEPAQETDESAPPDHEAERRRSRVRIVITYLASAYLFIVGTGVAAYYMYIGNDTGKDIFLSIVPVSTGIIGYWFATRTNSALSADDFLKLMNARPK